MAKYIILGAGGFGRELGEYLQDCLRDGALSGEFLGYLDDTIPAGALTKMGDKVLGPITSEALVPDVKFLIGLGDPSSRSEIFCVYKKKGASFETLVHPSAYNSSSSVIGEGGILCPYSFVGSCAKLKQNCLLNIYASVGHDCKLGDSSVLSPYATLNGNVTLNKLCFLGTKAVVTKGCTVGEFSKISSAAVVYNDLPDHSLAFGNPARMKKTI